ncbi:flagellar basal body-associated FliL family protein [Periweissella beninensis]|uniref:Flagellar protein FliL n=1 Tax=Periweissella beninensis TaxID=504936 RepID=A0ABT0VH54_9LACO|nr:flagellar basal body-associated FliL family protein [Periweissella beninensis]MBM7544702.1 flagellar FliL protein [Periweissella beninensis]MCM2436940.1 flagellar basal body-associated FliL family protein [Periweissella beninensis]MCT4396327.1 hypothetical protein [Periweissella beninensis]
MANKAAPKEKRGPRWAIIIPLLLTVMVAAGIGGAFVISQYNAKNTSPTAQSEAAASEAASKRRVIPLSRFIVNLASSGNQDQYIRVSMSLIVASPEEKSALNKQMPLVRDSVITVLSQKKARDILDGGHKLNALKNQIKTAINNAYGAQIVEDVYITDLVVQ